MTAHPLLHKVSRLLLLATVALAAAIAAGCGSGTNMTGPVLRGNTTVVVLLSSTANDQLAEFDLGFQSLTVTNQSGETVTLLAMPTPGPRLGAEFMHINGTAEPLGTATIPQDVYTAATVTFSDAQFACVALGLSGGQEELNTSTFTDLGTLPATVSVNLPSPITVTGSSMGLALDLQVSRSATGFSCFNPNGILYSYSITPTFNLTPLTLSSSPTNSADGKVTGLDGEIAALGSSGNRFTLSLPDLEGPRPLSVSSDSNTEYQGISGFSALSVGGYVDIDGAVQSDGSVLATRIAVEDASAVDVLRGPLIEVVPSASILNVHAHNWQGKDVAGFGGAGAFAFQFGSALFQISGQLTNLGNLPFAPSFNASNMVPGQEVYVSSLLIPPGGYPSAATVTLMPQPINGMVTAGSPSGNFTDYTISLASYDLFPMLAVQAGQTTVENNPSQVEVYVDSNTQLLNRQSLAVGGTFRFYGLIFNDNGALRMDCEQVSDGVAFSPQPGGASGAGFEQTQTMRRVGPGGFQLTNTFTLSH